MDAQREVTVLTDCETFCYAFTGLDSAILGWGLAAGGYKGELTVQAQSALNAETFLLFIVPAIASAACFVAIWFWDIDKKIAELRQ